MTITLIVWYYNLDHRHDARALTCVKADFSSSLHTFLCNLTDLRYKMLGLTVIYLPLEGNDLSVAEASADKELAKRLEGVVVHWTRQIRLALGDQDQSTPHQLLCITDEYDFWIYRCESGGMAEVMLNTAVGKVTRNERSFGTVSS